MKEEVVLYQIWLLRIYLGVMTTAAVENLLGVIVSIFRVMSDFPGYSFGYFKEYIKLCSQVLYSKYIQFLISRIIV